MDHYRQTGEDTGFHPFTAWIKALPVCWCCQTSPLSGTAEGLIHTRRFHRVYLALCVQRRPQPTQGIIDAPIGPVGAPAPARSDPGGKPARTYYRVLQIPARPAPWWNWR